MSSQVRLGYLEISPEVIPPAFLNDSLREIQIGHSKSACIWPRTCEVGKSE